MVYLCKKNQKNFTYFGVVIAICLIQLVGCGYSSPAATGPSGTQAVSGTVNTVTLTSVLNGAGGMQTATAVGLTAALGTNSLVLCGDQRSMFTLNTSVNVSYTNGTYCSSLVSVTAH